MTQTEGARQFGASLRALNKRIATGRAVRLPALKQKRRGRRAGEGRLSPAQAQRIRALIVGKIPDQLKLPFYLWTRAAVAKLIDREFGVAVSPTTVGRYLNALNKPPLDICN